MAKLPRAAIISIALVAITYQFLIRKILFDILGYGRALDPLSSFNATCHRISTLGLESCEDMWLHQPSGLLYMACSDCRSRMQWCPSADMFNASARPLTDRLAIISTRAPGPLASRLQWITPSHFSGVNGDASLNLNGFDVRTIPGSDTLQILLVNHRPSLGPNVNSANSTIELFETQLGSSTMRHVRTFADEAIHAPNRVAWVAQDAFVFTNDRSPQGTFGRKLDLVLGGGSVGYCHSTGCHLIQPSGFRYPNGLVRGHDGLIYVPDSMTGKIHVFVLTRDKIFEEVDTIQLPYGIDNLSVDEDGDIFAATFPVSWKFLQSLKDPYGINPPMTIFRVRKREGGYEVEKVLEDDGSVLPAATTAVHDVKGEMMWMGGSFAPYVSVCQMH